MANKYLFLVFSIIAHFEMEYAQENSENNLKRHTIFKSIFIMHLFRDNIACVANNFNEFLQGNVLKLAKKYYILKSDFLENK